MGHYNVRYALPAPGEVFVDTGAYQGESLALALEAGYAHAYGIEVCPAHAAACATRFADEPRAEVREGSSHRLLGPLLDELAGKRLTVWHDAHFQGGGRDEQDPQAGECPLLAELAAVVERWRTFAAPPTLLIDDAPLFELDWRTEPGAFDPAQWPARSQIQRVLGPYYARPVLVDNVWVYKEA